MDHKSVIEAALFMSQKPLDLHELAKITGLSSLGFLKEALEGLQKEYAKHGIQVTCQDGRWHMQVRPELLPQVASLTPYQDMPEGPKRTLALVVYKEPVKQSDIIHIQGNKAYAYVKHLKKIGLIKAEQEGHTNILTTTKGLETYFGMGKDAIKKQLAVVKSPDPAPAPQAKPADSDAEAEDAEGA
ncbi:MAG: SMC-Scp complex subunit ScpB [Candidatus Aenigmarchaeota archaeon]|nr:SMC-Scp complex subunit ScpB [Candidatus Aenigmarchaeota archaeon]